MSKKSQVISETTMQSNFRLTHSGLVRQFGDTDLGQHWLRSWLVADGTKPLPDPIANVDSRLLSSRRPPPTDGSLLGTPESPLHMGTFSAKCPQNWVIYFIIISTTGLQTAYFQGLWSPETLNSLRPSDAYMRQ